MIRNAASSSTQLYLGALGFFIVLVVWSAVTYTRLVPSIFLPSPSGIVGAIRDLQRADWLLPAIGRSSARVLVSLGLVTTFGVIIGIAMGVSTTVDGLLRPLVAAGKSIPIPGLVGLIVLWFSIEEAAKIVFLFLGSIFYMISLVREAIRDIDQRFIDLADDLGASPFQKLTSVIIPGSLPRIWDAVSTSTSLMWTYIILAEFINSNQAQLGIGYILYIGSRTQNSAQVFATLLIICVLALLSDGFFRAVRSRLFFWT